MGWRGTVLLGFALLAAALLLYRDFAAENRELSWKSVIAGPRATAPGDGITRLLSFEPASVTAVRLQRGDQRWSAERRDGRWTVARPGDVDDLLTNLLGLAQIMPLQVAPDELADHGLDPPESVIELERAGQPPILLLLGRHNPPATGVYAQLGRGGPVFLTGALALWEFDKAMRAMSGAP